MQSTNAKHKCKAQMQSTNAKHKCKAQMEMEKNANASASSNAHANAKCNYARDSDFCAHSLHVQPNVRLKGTPGVKHRVSLE